MTENLLQAVAVLKVSDFETAEVFYGNKLGFVKDWSYQPHEDRINPTYAGFSREGAQIHVTSFPGDGALGGVALFYVEDVDALYRQFVAAGVSISLEPVDQTWGQREMYVEDADGNSLRFSQLAGTVSNAE